MSSFTKDWDLLACLSKDFELPVEFFELRYGTTNDQILETLKKIDILSLSDDNKRATILFPRQTIIFRDVPESVQSDECRNIFSAETQKEIVSITKDSNQMWYIKFNSELMAHKALDESQNSKLLGGEPLRSRLKNEIPVLPDFSNENLANMQYINQNYEYSYKKPPKQQFDDGTQRESSYGKNRGYKNNKRGGFNQGKRNQ